MTLEEFVFNLPLYQVVDENNGYNEIKKDLMQGSTDITIEGYNPVFKKDSTFFLEKGMGNLKEHNINSILCYTYDHRLANTEGVVTIVFQCQRYHNAITISLLHDPEHSILMKVGQYPSVADVHIGQVKKYDKVLEKSNLREFTKAIGLVANGVGIGSFVYLRRIFEKLVFDAFSEAEKEINVDAKAFEKQRMDEKIKLLKGYLPQFIVENSSIYGILSKGIHELSEEECLAYFDTMRDSIEMILDQRVEQREKKKKEEEVRKKISEIASKLK